MGVLNFQTNSMHISELRRRNHSGGSHHNAGVVPAAFNLWWYIDNWHYLEEDTTPNLVHEENITISN